MPRFIFHTTRFESIREVYDVTSLQSVYGSGDCRRQNDVTVIRCIASNYHHRHHLVAIRSWKTSDTIEARDGVGERSSRHALTAVPNNIHKIECTKTRLCQFEITLMSIHFSDRLYLAMDPKI